VGLPLSIAFSEKYETKAYDVNEKRIQELQNSFDRNQDISETLIKNSNVCFTANLEEISDSNIFIITVPTPVDDENIPDLTILLSASKTIAPFLKKNDIVIYESTVYPGVTEDECVPVLENYSGLKYNFDFFCGYSPERISPSEKDGQLQKIIKLVSGSNKTTTDVVEELYRSIIPAGTHRTSSIKVAEAAKVVENTQRDVNIALINEIAIMFDKMNINTSEVLEAASTKWNFVDIKPGLVGGHCIGVDPYYLTYKSEKMGFRPNLILSSREINNSVPNFIVKKTIKLLIKNNKSIKNSKILILGYTFKENCSDTRNTQVQKIIDELEEYGCNVSFYDPYIKNHNKCEKNPFTKHKFYDAIIIAVAHKEFFSYSKKDFKLISNGKLVLLDVKGVIKNPTWQF